ncbi:MAG TPA: hypothetical protein VMK31_00765 [Sphingomicrobium sp.]|nr:hypothetical protein [Sphingomicrobium sp.]
MSGPGRWIAAAAGALLMAAAVGAGFALRGQSDPVEPRAPGERPPLMLLSALPIVFPESFTLEADQSQVLDALASRYEVIPISLADRAALHDSRLLLMAQPQAQPAQVLVELDSWVRGGGRALVLADPSLEWPSALMLGDRRRPPMAFADTGLLAHWGLRLDAPDRAGPATFELDGRVVNAASPGSLIATGGNCEIAASGLVARCRVGEGRATVIADADFIDAERRGPALSANLAALLSEIERLEPEHQAK